MSCTSTKARCPRQRLLVTHDVQRTVFLRGQPPQPLQRGLAQRVQDQPRRLGERVHPTQVARERQGVKLAPRSSGSVHPYAASVLADGYTSHDSRRHLETAGIEARAVNAFTTMETNPRTNGRRAKRWMLIAICAAFLALGGGWWALEEGRPWLYGLDAYVYSFPLIMMDLTKEVSTPVPTAGEITAPVNQFSVMTHYPDASFRAVARTGLDTLFAVAWADLDKEPLVLSVPDTDGRYYVIALFDLWSNVFASIGKRTTGTGAGSFLIAGPGWHGTPPSDVKQVFRSPTRFVWVNGQMQANGPADYVAVNALQKQYKLTPLSAWGRPYTAPAEVPVAAGVDAKTPPLERV